jgi:hypothetical protein
MDDYISALDAAKQIGMEPERFATVLRELRDRLPTEINSYRLKEHHNPQIYDRKESYYYSEHKLLDIKRLEHTSHIFL